MIAVLLAAALIIPSFPTAAAPAPFWEQKGCDHPHRSAVAYERLRTLLRHTSPWVNKRRVSHYRTCLATRAKAREAHRRAKSHWAWRHEYTQLWKIRFNRLPYTDRAWAYSTSSCEAGMDPQAHNPSGVYHGGFQFLLSTWQAAGGTADPHTHSWEAQAVTAVQWMRRAGRGQWPVCGT